MKYIFFFLSIILASTFVSCSDNDSVDECVAVSHRNIQDSIEIAPGNSFDISSDSAMKDCHATFDLYYAYANENRRTSDTSEPIVSWEFNTWGGMFYFPTASAKRETNANGEYWWHASNNIAAKNETGDYTIYGIHAKPASTNAYNIVIKAKLTWAPYRKQ